MSMKNKKNIDFKSFIFGGVIITLVLTVMGAVLATYYVGTNNINMQGSKIEYLAMPTAGSDAVNKDYVDAAVAAAGGGIRWAGYTTSTYTGNLSGIKGAHEKCNATFEGSRWAKGSELDALGLEYPYSYEVWINSPEEVIGKGSGSTSGHIVFGDSYVLSHTAYNLKYIDCMYWTYDDNSVRKGMVIGSSGGRTLEGCSNSLRLPCVYPQ